MAIRGAVLASLLLLWFGAPFGPAVKADDVAPAGIDSGTSTALVSSADEVAMAGLEDAAMKAGALGWYVDTKQDALVVVVPRTLQGGFSVDGLAAAPVKVVTRWSDLEAADLSATRAKLQDLMTDPNLSQGSMTLHFDPEHEKLVVSTSVPFDTVATTLGDSASLIEYRDGGAAQLLTGRSADVSPFHGAAKIKFDSDPPGSYCTSGFTVLNGSVRAMLVPAHCGDVSTVARTWAGVNIGTTGTDRHCGPSPTGDNSDFQFIRGMSYTDSIYLGGDPGFLGNVLEWGVPAIGATYRFSGATTHETGQIEAVTSTDDSVWIQPGTYCTTTGWWLLHLITFSSDAMCDGQLGDSGSPFYFRNSSSPYNVRIRGMVVARQVNPDGTIGPNCYAIKTTTVASDSGYSILTTP